MVLNQVVLVETVVLEVVFQMLLEHLDNLRVDIIILLVAVVEMLVHVVVPLALLLEPVV